MTVRSGPFPAVSADVSPAIVGHRGSGRGMSPGGHRENTIGSFLEAVGNGATWIECDVQVTSDGVLVLRHNVAGEGVIVSQSRYADLAPFGWDTLADVHAALPVHVGIDAEIKVGLPDDLGGDPVIDAALTWIVARRDERPWLVTSFDPTVILAASARGLHSGWLTTFDWSLYEHLAAAVRLGSDVIAVNAQSLRVLSTAGPSLEVLMATAARHGIQVLTWDALPGDVPLLRAAGVAAVCVDDVAAVRVAMSGSLALAS